MADLGFKISKPGKDITSKDPRDYIIHSKYPGLLIKTQGVGSIVITAGTANTDVIISIPHGLSYMPCFMAYGVNNLAAGNLVDIQGGFGASSDNATWTGYSDLTNINLVINGTQGTYAYYYYIFFHDGTTIDTSGITLGNDYGIKISKEGASINSTDPKDYTLHSGYNMFKIALTGTGTMTRNTIAVIPHNLGYRPAFVIYTDRNNDGKYWCGGYPSVPESGAADLLRAYSNTTNLYIESVATSGGTIPYKYYLFYDPVT